MFDSLLYIVWRVSPDLQLGSLSIHLYGLFFAFGLLMGGIVVIRLMSQYRTSQSYLFYAFVGIIVGARLFHCLLYDPYYYCINWIEIFLPVKNIDGTMVFSGFWGFASHGGVVGLMIALLIFSKRNGISYLGVCDVFAIATPLTGAFIRLGNLMNSEILGKATDIPTAFIFTNVDNIPRHPAALYEALWYFVLFAVLWLVYKKNGFTKYKKGFYMGIAFVGVALFRFFIEFLKENQENFLNTLPINMGQILSIPFIVVGIVLTLKCYRKKNDNV